MSNLSGNKEDDTLLLVGLLLLKELLPRARYSTSTKEQMSKRLDALIERMQSDKPTHDAYGNPHAW